MIYRAAFIDTPRKFAANIDVAKALVVGDTISLSNYYFDEYDQESKTSVEYRIPLYFLEKFLEFSRHLSEKLTV